MELASYHRQILLNAARAAIRHALTKTGDPDPIASEDPVLMLAAGCFVSLHDRFSHRLRGCIGRMISADPLLQLVRQTAVGVLADPRFARDPVTNEELPQLALEISVLSPLAAASHPLDFDLGNDGIYLVYGDRAGCFLPQVAHDTGWTREELLGRLCSEKLGLAPMIWRSPEAKLKKFTVTVVGPEPFCGQEIG